MYVNLGTALHFRLLTPFITDIVLPMRPKGTEGWTEEQLAALVTRDAMVGCAPVKIPPQQ